jgi:DNA-binding NtrC family response regulator
LKNAVERAVILARGEQVALVDLSANQLIASEDREMRVQVGTSLEQAERTLVLKTFSFVDGDHQRAAFMLGKDEAWLRERLNDLLTTH